MAALVGKVALVLFALPVTCLALCTFGVQPIHGWMMRHGCPLARWTMHPPSHPMGVTPTALPRRR
jgi:hypothetical protein